MKNKLNLYKGLTIGESGRAISVEKVNSENIYLRLKNDNQRRIIPTQLILDILPHLRSKKISIQDINRKYRGDHNAANACFFHRLIWVAWTACSAVNSLVVFCCRIASMATFAFCLLYDFCVHLPVFPHFLIVPSILTGGLKYGEYHKPDINQLKMFSKYCFSIADKRGNPKTSSFGTYSPPPLKRGD